MTLADIDAAALFVGVLAYALFAGADFGTGFYDLMAGGAERGRATRTQIDHSLGPVWEANHVWLIYVLVVWWTGFPTSFAAVTTTLFVPLCLALLGIVLRGAAFAYRKFAPTMRWAELYGSVFAFSSLLAPFFFGTVVGAIASGRVPAAGYGPLFASWLTVSSLVGGLLACGACMFLAGVYLVADAWRSGDEELARQLRRRTLTVAGVVGVLVFVAIFPFRRDAPTLSAGLLGRGLPTMVLSAVAGLATIWLLSRWKVQAARVSAALAVLFVLAGWGLAQYPWLLVDQMSIAQAAGAHATMQALLVVAILAGVVVLPPLAWLLRLTQRWR